MAGAEPAVQESGDRPLQVPVQDYPAAIEQETSAIVPASVFNFGSEPLDVNRAKQTPEK
jgi:hypothetical protein